MGVMTGIKGLNGKCNEATAGMSIGVCVRGIPTYDIKRGDILSNFEAEKDQFKAASRITVQILLMK